MFSFVQLAFFTDWLTYLSYLELFALQAPFEGVPVFPSCYFQGCTLFQLTQVSAPSCKKTNYPDRKLANKKLSLCHHDNLREAGVELPHAKLLFLVGELPLLEPFNNTKEFRGRNFKFAGDKSNQGTNAAPLFMQRIKCRSRRHLPNYGNFPLQVAGPVFCPATGVGLDGLWGISPQVCDAIALPCKVDARIIEARRAPAHAKKC